MPDSLYKLTSHIWLQRYLEKFQAANILTGRRLLLEQKELAEFLRFGFGAELQSVHPLHKRMLEADLLVGTDATASSDTPRLEMLDKRVTRFLAEHLKTSRSKIEARLPTLAQRLSEAHKTVVSQVNHLPQSQQEVVQKDLGVLFSHVQTFLKKEMTQEEFTFQTDFLIKTAGRPLPREDYEQQPCLPETSQRRMEMARGFLREDSRGLILGDDDLLSLYWSLEFSQPCDVFELDVELMDFLTPQLSDNVTLRPRDLTQGLPPEFCGRYDLVFTDPMYERKGMDLFLQCCADALSDHPQARVLFTTRQDMIDDGELLEDRFTQVGLEVEKRFKDFSRYRLPDFYRRKLLKGFHQAGLSPQLVDGLSQIPYLYADMFWLKKS